MTSIVFIPGNVPSSKNSKVSCARGVFHSRTVQRYLQAIGVKDYSVSKRTVSNYKTRPNWFYEQANGICVNETQYPVKIGFHFVRDTKMRPSHR